MNLARATLAFRMPTLETNVSQLGWLCIGAFSDTNRESKWDDVTRWLTLSGPLFPGITSLLFVRARFNLTICGVVMAIHTMVYAVLVDLSPPVFASSNKTLVFPTVSGGLFFGAPSSLLDGEVPKFQPCVIHVSDSAGPMLHS